MPRHHPLFSPFEGGPDWPKPVHRDPHKKPDPKQGDEDRPPGSVYDDKNLDPEHTPLHVADEEGEIDPRLVNPATNKTVTAGTGPGASDKIRTFQQQLGGRRHEDTWKRSPNVTGAGAIHVKSFHCKLTGDSLAFLDRQINEWLDEHPQYEVKMVTTSIGLWTGKLKEPNLIVNVWV
ncbi:MAG: hypothetical protein R3B57_09945 [Phycisphaerales bacterium]